MKKFIITTLALIILLVVCFVSFVELTYDKIHAAPYPEITASTDSAVIARGEYLAFGPAHCIVCHSPLDKRKEIDAGLKMPLTGGWELIIPPGTFRAPNLTPDEETGIGRYNDAEVARILRYSVGHDGRTIFPFMPFQEMSDEDLTAVISFLRSQEPVKNEIQRSELTFLGKAVMALGLLKPEGPENAPPKAVPIDTTIEYGEYIANNVADCVGCHTARDLETGEYIGPKFAGGFTMPSDNLSEGYSFITPNLTPDEETGIMALWNENAFVGRFRAGRVHKNSPMPWGPYSRMNDVELKALFKYLKSLEPVSNKIEKIVFAPGEALPD